MTTSNRKNASRVRVRSAFFGKISDRMQSDLRLAVVTLFAASSLCIIGPFAVYRFSIGQWQAGFGNVTIIVVFCSMAALAWHPRWTRVAANVFAATAALGGMFMVLIVGNSPMWLFGALVGNFLMADRHLAVTASALMIGSVALHPETFPNRTEYVTFIAVGTMVSLFSLIFSARVDSQHSELARIAERDGLTGALNRRSLDRNLAAIRIQNGAAHRPHSLVMIDIDDFKTLNDTHGHEAGDRVLVRLTELIGSNTRGSDRFYRYGGEEFVLLLDQTTLEQAQVAVDNLRDVLARNLKGPAGPVTVSMGLAERQPGEACDDWLCRADRALLEAKRAGKDCCKVA